MVIPLSQLEYYFASVLLKAQAARSHAMAQGTPISTEDPDSITITCEVIDDTAKFLPTSITESYQPETISETTKAPERSVSSTKQSGVVTKEIQTTKTGKQVTSQAFGRGNITIVEETD